MKTKKITKKKAFKLFIAWDKSSSNFLEQYGYALTKKAQDGKLKLQLPHDDQISNYNVEEWNTDEKSFNTKAELIAYCEGINDGNGWDSPSTEEIK